MLDILSNLRAGPKVKLLIEHKSVSVPTLCRNEDIVLHVCFYCRYNLADAKKILYFKLNEMLENFG